ISVLQQEMAARSARATQPAVASSTGDVYWGDSVQQTSGGNLGSSSTPAGGSSNDVFWGNPQLDISGEHGIGDGGSSRPSSIRHSAPSSVLKPRRGSEPGRSRARPAAR